MFDDNGPAAVRSGNRKYFRSISHNVRPIPLDKPATPPGKAAQDRFPGSRPNLYNIQTDKGENYDLASHHPEVCKKMESAMTAWENSIKKNPGGWTR